MTIIGRGQKKNSSIDVIDTTNLGVCDDLRSAIMILEKEGWFSQRPQKTRALLTTIAQLRKFSKNEPVYLAGDRANGVFGLVRGSLHISIPRIDGEDFIAHRAGAGFWIGDLALFAGEERLVSVRAAEPTQMVQLPADALQQLVRDNPWLYEDFYALTYQNFRTTFAILSMLSMSSTTKRVATKLLLQVETRADREGWIDISQPELAGLLAISLPTLQRIMRRFQAAGFIKSSYARIQVLDRNALAQICGEYR
ncbi:MAG: Crp/Fnr family transcriptional regulator [Xanthobacteraceae bacterium]